MPDIFDNLAPSTTLGPALSQAAQTFPHVDVATGYLDLRGWSALGDVITTKSSGGKEPAARVLVGMVMASDKQQLLTALQDQVQPPPYGTDIPDRSKALRARDALVRHLREQLMRGLPSATQREELQALAEQLRSGTVEMRVFTSQPLHGKTYIFRDPNAPQLKTMAYLGSSNLTGAGLTRNLELNVDVMDQQAAQRLAVWFQDRWSDPFTLPVTAEIIELIEESWAGEQQPTPYDVYLKVCHSLSEDAREGLGYTLPPSLQNLLLDYQETAVRTLARRTVRRGGTMLGDVVGLGKTLTAIATAKMLEGAEDYSTLVLCPKNLGRMWEEHLDRYDLAGARVVRYSMADKVLPELKRFHLVICDESHNLRNNTTKVSESIHDYVRRNGSKVLLLTATPYNLAFADVANQIGLYIDEDDDLGIQPTAAMTLDPGLADKVDGKVTTLTAFRRSEEAEDWKRLMSDHLVRRTRSFVKRTARKQKVTLSGGSVVEREYLEFADGTRFFFPERVPRPLTHDFSDGDPAQQMEDDATLDAVSELCLPRYRLADYDDPKAAHTQSDTKYLDDIRSGRGNVSGFVRIGLFKRLSSSGHSFIVSLQRQRARNELFVHAIDEGFPVPIGSFSDHQFQVTDEDVEDTEDLGGSLDARYQALRSRLPASTKWINTGVFKRTLRKDLVRDNRIITELLDGFGPWDPSRDSKLNAVVDLIRDEHPGEKVLVFSEYVDTAAYVADQLGDAGLGAVALASGQTADPAALARRFSPRSNVLPGKDPDTDPGDPLDILVATDVLSEGQNLQDCHIVVNYDLPWAIIRIIQRAGRVDRVGQRSDVVYVYSIMHSNIERQIKLHQRIRARLSANAAAFGSDERFFGTDDEVNILEGLYEGRMPEGDEVDVADGEADAVSEAWLVWSKVQQADPALAARIVGMQDLVHSTRDPYGHEKTGGVTAYAATASGIDAFAMSWTDAEGVDRERLLTPLEALRVFRAEPTTPTVAVRPDHFEREAKLVHGNLVTEMVAVGNLRGIRKWAVEKLGGTRFGQQASAAVDAMAERPLTEYANLRLRQARRQRLSEPDLVVLVNQLLADDRLVIGSTDRDAITLRCSIGVSDQ